MSDGGAVRVMDLDALREALRRYEGLAVVSIDGQTSHWATIVAAARAVLDSEEGSYCETHRYPSQWVTATNCRHGAEVERPEECEMVPVSVVRRHLLAEEK